MAAKALMIQGTMSNAGKSWVTAGLCRAFARDGYRVAPFKAQNMALNSFVTRDGLEMGRAQAVQAEAAFREPDVRMNPILLKPTGEYGSQVVVGGEVLGEVPTADYFGMKRSLRAAVRAAYDSLAAENDIIVIEGAGSPAEINLKADDIVNMGMAKMAAAPVLLVGDIDRGGVFASLYGTVMLCTPAERALIKGTIINKFRGDVELLRPGLRMLEELIRIPTLGVVPYARLDIDDEDSLSGGLEKTVGDGLLDVAVVRLPRISNFTDFSPLGRLPGMSLRYIDRPEKVKGADLLILPGTKNTLGDLRWLWESGMADALLRHAAAGGAVIGICGGYQMLCRTVSDPDGFEEGGTLPGLGLLPAETVFTPRKERARVTGFVGRLEGLFAPLSGVRFEGYELHMGRTAVKGEKPLANLHTAAGNTKEDGLCRGNVLGTYVHGFFDSGDVLDALARSLVSAKGMDWTPEVVPDMAAHKQREYDRLAALLREALDMRTIYEILEQGV